MSTPGPESLDARLVRFRSRGNIDDAQPLVRDLLDAGRAAEAAEVAEALTESTPSSFDAWMLLASARQADRDLSAAQRAWTEAVRRAPQRAEPYRHLADLLLDRGDLDRAERLVARGLDLSGNDAGLVMRRDRIVAERARLAPAAPATPAAPGARLTPIAPVPTVVLAQASVPPEARLSSSPTPPRAPSAPTTAPRTPSHQPTPAWPPQAPQAARVTVPPGARASVPPGARVSVAPPPPPPPVFEYEPDPAAGSDAEPEEELEIDPESTLVASRAELDKLRNLGALRPSNPPTKNVGAPWTEAPQDAPSVKPLPAIPPTPLAPKAPLAPVETIRVRADVTAPYRLDTAANTAPRGDTAAAAVGSDSPGSAASAVTPTAGASGAPAVRADAAFPGNDSTSSLTGAGRTAKRSAPRRRPAMVLAGFALIGAIGGTAAIQWKSRAERHERLETVSSGLFAADAVSTQRARDAATALVSLTADQHRDLRLEAELIRFVEVGGVSADELRRVRLGARTHGVDPGWIAASNAAEALLAGDVALAGRQLGSTSQLPADSRLAFVQAGLASRLGRRADARVLLAGLERLTQGAPSVMLALAELDRSEGKADEAAARITALLRAHPDHARARLVRLSMALDANSAEVPEAGNLERDLAQTTAAEKAWGDAVLARLAAASGEHADAARRVDRAAGAEGLAPSALLDLAAAEAAVGRPARARERIDAAFGASPDDARARQLLGIALAHLGRGDEALALLSSSGGASALEARALAALHASSSQARNIADAIRVLGVSATTRLRAYEIRLRLAAGESPAELLVRAEALRNDHPTDRDALVAFAACAAAADRWDVLSGSFGAEADAAPELAAFRARSAMRRGSVADAEQALSALSASAPNGPDTLVVRGYVQTEKGEFEAALGTYRDLVGTEGLVLEGPARVVGLAAQTAVLLSLGRVPEAQAAFATLSEAERASAPALSVGARLAVAAGRPTEAIATLESHAAAANASAEVLTLFGDAVLATGDPDRALELYRRAVGVDPTLPEPHLGLAAVFVRIERFDDANSELVRCRRALDARPRGPAAEGLYFTLFGRTALGRNQKEEARFALRRAITFSGVPAEAHFFLGEALSGANSPDARAAYERYLSLAPEGDFAGRARRAL